MRMGYKTLPFLGLDVHDTHEEFELGRLQNHFQQFSYHASVQNQFYVDQVTNEVILIRRMNNFVSAKSTAEVKLTVVSTL